MPGGETDFTGQEPGHRSGGNHSDPGRREWGAGQGATAEVVRSRQTPDLLEGRSGGFDTANEARGRGIIISEFWTELWEGWGCHFCHEKKHARRRFGEIQKFGVGHGSWGCLLGFQVGILRQYTAGSMGRSQDMGACP